METEIKAAPIVPCKQLSTHAHRYCPGCSWCPCHEALHHSNYGKDGDTIAERKARAKLVRRVG